MITIVAFIIIVTSLIYACLIGWFFVGWIRSKGVSNQKSDKRMGDAGHICFSVVVAARNEAHRITALLDALLKQDWPADQFEVIVVDDHSTDNTLDLAEAFGRKSQQICIRLLSARMCGSHPGKKHALNLGIRDARGDFIVTTDADCQPQPGWLQAMASCIDTTKADMVLGPVQVDGSKACFARMQELEFMSLMGVTGGSAGTGNPLMANGANLAFRKMLYVAVNGYEGNMQYASGDDVFLLHKFKRLPGCRLVFLKERAAIVNTLPSISLKAFFRQRGRWAGKAGGYRDGFTLFVGAVVALINLILAASLLILPVLIWTQAWFTSLSGGMPEADLWFGNFEISDTTMLVATLCFAWMMKFLVDFLILLPVTGFFRHRRLLWHFLPVFLVYPVYVVVSLLWGLRRK